MSNTDLQAALVRAAIVTVEQVRDAVEAVRGTSASWLEHLVLTGQLDEELLARCAGAEVCVPPCSLDRLALLPREVIARLPRDLAVEHRMVPMWIEPDGDLSVAMLDPCDLAAVHEVEFFLEAHVLREVAPATPLSWALATYYGARCPLWPRPSARPSRVVDVPAPPQRLGEVARELEASTVLYELADAPTDRFVRAARHAGY